MEMTTAQTILEQLGGRAFIAMTGAKNLAGSEEDRYLQFDLPAGTAKKKIRKVRIAVVGDLYNLTFYAVKRVEYAPGFKFPEPVIVESKEMIGAENLRDVFEDVTGLYTRL